MIQWITQNWDLLVEILLAALALAKLIANLTPTEKDNNFLGKVGKWIDRLIPNRKAGGGKH